MVTEKETKFMRILLPKKSIYENDLETDSLVQKNNIHLKGGCETKWWWVGLYPSICYGVLVIFPKLTKLQEQNKNGNSAIAESIKTLTGHFNGNIICQAKQRGPLTIGPKF